MSFVVGPFLGVIGGFASERAIVWYKNKVNRTKLKENIRDELTRCIERLSGEGNLLPTTMWNSTMATGDLKLLSFSQRTKLSAIYFDIENHNSEAKRVRDGAVIAKTGPQNVRIVGIGSLAEYYWKELSKQLIIAEKDLKRKIAKFLEESWLKN
jgi:hypothetical protein